MIIKKKRLIIAAVALIFITSYLGLYMNNTHVNVETIPVSITGLPEEFNGLRIAQLSDLHLPHCALPPDKLAALVEKQHPDLIFLTGDVIDRYSRFDSQDLLLLAQRLTAIAPCYAVAGNHEIESGTFDRWSTILRGANVTVLDNEWTSVRRGNSEIAICGLTNGKPDELSNKEALPAVKIVLSHYPQFINAYADAGYSLVFAGHAHGGQVRAFGQGLFAPGQGFFPKYTSGLYQLNKTQMVVSRGLINSLFPIRVFNRPDIPSIVIRSI